MKVLDGSNTPGQDQVIEERVDSSTTAERQFTWGTRYIDDLVMRTRDTDANGTLDETLYALTDITYDVVALADSTGAVVGGSSMIRMGSRKSSMPTSRRMPMG